MAEGEQAKDVRQSQLLAKRSKIVILVIAAFCVFIGFLFMRTLREMQAQSQSGASCIANIEVMHAAVASYVEEHGTFPNAATWNEDVAPYMQEYLDVVNAKMEDAPAYMSINLVGVGGAPTCEFPNEQPTAIALNSALAGRSVGELELTPQTPLLAVHGPSEPNATFRAEDLKMQAGGSRFDPGRLEIATTLEGKKTIGEDTIEFDMIDEKPGFNLNLNRN